MLSFKRYLSSIFIQLNEENRTFAMLGCIKNKSTVIVLIILSLISLVFFLIKPKAPQNKNETKAKPTGKNVKNRTF